ncbi:MAG: hypothetical protein FWG87_13215 [Defluviitaleaceae bacterium]|nr:hypothetical protein [Defluviitaleaceae bacterium]
MKGITYNLEKLIASGNFDTGVIERFYYDKQEYFDALTDFRYDYKRDLTNYTPAFVINSKEDSEEFMKECFEIRAIFIKLGFTAVLETLVRLEDAAISHSEKAFSDAQIRFRATLKICKDELQAAANRWKITR